MTAREFILEKLRGLTTKFPQVRARYEYDALAELHVVEVVPNEVYHLNDSYAVWMGETTSEFIRLYPTEGVCFVSDDALVGIENAEYISEGLAFAQITAYDQSTMTPTLFDNLLEPSLRISGKMDDTMPPNYKNQGAVSWQNPYSFNLTQFPLAAA